MRVLNVNHILDPVHGGGTAERTFQLSRLLVRNGFKCSLLTTAAGSLSSRTAFLAGVDVISVPLLSERFFVPRISWSLLKRLVSDADVIHMMGHWTILNAIVYRAARKLRKPYVVCPAGALPIYGRSRLFKRLYNLLVGRSLVRNADACIAITEEEIDHFTRYGVERTRICVIPNGVSPEDFKADDGAEFREKYGLGAHPFALFMGRLNHIKGPDLLLRAFGAVQQAFPHFHLVFAGPDGGMLSDLQRFAHANDLAERVHFVGHVGGTEKSSAFRAASLLVIPSRHEAMSIVVLEAGIIGTPVLLTDQCGFNVIDGCGGKVVTATEHDLASGLAELLREPSLLEEMGRALNRFVCERHLWTSVISRYVALFERLTHKAVT